MIGNYFITAIRSFKQYKQHVALNIFGLSIGLAASILVALFVRYELSFDKFQPNSQQTYRLHQFWTSFNTGVPFTNLYVTEQLKEISGVEDVMVLRTETDTKGEFSFKDNKIKLQKIFAATTNIKDFIALDVLHGDLQKTLSQPYYLALNQSEALRIFGIENAVGKVLTKNEQSWKIGAVFADIPKNSHYSFTGLKQVTRGQISYGSNNSYSYIRLDRQANSSLIESQINQKYHDLVYKKHDQGFAEITLQPLQKIHLHSASNHEMKINGSHVAVTICIGLSALLVVLASSNFINMSITQSVRRAKEVGVRKALGASTTQITTQFIIESVLISLLALLLSCAIVEAVLPAFNQLVERDLTMHYWSEFGGALLLLGFGVGVLTGVYPALFMAAFSARRVLSGDLNRGKTAVVVRKSILVFQAALSIALIIVAITLQQQLSHLMNLATGYSKDARIEISNLPKNKIFSQDSAGLFERISNIAGVKHVGVIDASLTGSVNTSMSLTSGNGQLVDTRVPFIGTGWQPIKSLGLTLLAGRDFEKNKSSDWFNENSQNVSSAGVLITRSLAMQAGFMSLENALGKTWRAPIGDNTVINLKIIGVIEDIKSGSVKDVSNPIFFICGLSWMWESQLLLNIELNYLTDIQRDITKILRDELNIYNPEIQLVSSNYKALYRNEAQIAKVITIFSSLALFLSCLGTFGLASFATLSRQKEVAMRKVLGASRINLMNLLAKEFLLLVMMSIVIAFPLSYWLVDDWLANFNERITQSIWVYFLSAAFITAITWLTVATLAFKAASTRPSLILRDE